MSRTIRSRLLAGGAVALSAALLSGCAVGGNEAGAELSDGDGSALRVEGRPHVEVTARRWTSEDLDAARHCADLVARDRVWLNVDLAQHGLGSGACGPAVLPPHRLEPR